MESRSTVKAAWEPNTVPVPFPVQEGVGTLFILGGSVTPQVMYDEYFRIAGGPSARVLHIPSATITFEDIPDVREYYYEFYEQNPASMGFLHTYDRSLAETPEFAAPLNEATGVWMGGGDQRRLEALFHGTPVVEGIHGVFRRGGIVSGTSSGTAVMSDVMINWGYEEIDYGRGFALYPRAIVDPHFTGRCRQKRVGRSVLKFPDQIGVGVDEKCALVVNGSHIGVFGLLGRSVWYHFPDPVANTVTRYRLDCGEALDLGVPVLGADPRVLEARLRAHREPEVLTLAQLLEPDPE